MSEPKTYSARDIERYHSGEMPAAEMHLLEKAALDDPMLADALEGYAGVRSASADLEMLKQRLQNRIEKTNGRRGRIFIAMPWLKAAAVFLIVAGSGLLVFQTFEKKNTLANSSKIESLNADKNGLAEKPKPDTVVPNFSTAATDSSGHTQDVAVVERKVQALKRKDANPIITLPKVEDGTAKQNSEAKVATKSNAFAKVNGYAELADSNRTVAENQAANVTVRTLNDSTKQVDVVMKKIDSPVDEVVISKAKVQPMARRSPVVVDSLEPEEGWSSFNDYVAGNLKAPDELKTKPSYNKEVELSFDVDSEGNPTNVKVTKSLCEKCDAEAIRLLKEGPKWRGRKTKGKVKIKFPFSP